MSVFGALSTLLFSINGALSLLKSLGAAMSKVFVGLSKLGPAFTKMGGLATAAFGLIKAGVVALATALGLPVAAVVAIVAAVAAAAIAIYVYWDEIKAAAAVAWEWIVGIWGQFSEWISGIAAAAAAKLAEFWDWLAAAPGRAWDGLVSIWGGFGDFFSNMIDGVKNMFANLWDGVKNGATDAWNRVKGWFGLGDDPADGTADKSPRLRTGGIIRGAGTGTSDSIRAWLSNGEGVINAKAVRHYGESFIHALNALMLPQTHFATGGIVGDLVPAGAGRASGLSDLHLNLLGQRTSGGIYADADGMRGIKRDLRKVARASRGPAPRWRGY